MCTIESGQHVCLGIHGTENAVPFLQDILYSGFCTKTDYDVSCLAMEWRSNGVKDVFVSVSCFDKTSQLMSPQVIPFIVSVPFFDKTSQLMSPQVISFAVSVPFFDKTSQLSMSFFDKTSQLMSLQVIPFTVSVSFFDKSSQLMSTQVIPFTFSVSFFDKTSQLMSTWHPSLPWSPLNLASPGFLPAVTLNNC